MDSNYDTQTFADPVNDSVSGVSDLKNILVKERSIGVFQKFEELLRAFSPSERLILYCLMIVLAGSTLFLLAQVSDIVSTTVPARAGEISEGEVGPARFINPILTLSQPDQDLTALIFSGLMRTLPDGSIVPDLASSYSISDDGTTYTFAIRPDATFHDGTPVSADDVLFTVQAAQNPEIKSPHRADWDGVQASAPDAHTVVFKLAKSYAPFIYNTTLGILPKHLWQSITPEEFPFTPLNTHPVGSGPYRVANFETDQSGAPTHYDLTAFSHFTLGEPYLRHIQFLFYPNQTALISAFNAGKISAIAGISPTDLTHLTQANTMTMSVALPRVFGVFFNQNRAQVLADTSVREALDAAIDKQALVQKVLNNYGVPLDGPIPPGVLGSMPGTSTNDEMASSTLSRADRATQILKRGGWTFSSTTSQWTKKKEVLSFTLATADEEELAATAREVAATWSAIGVDVKVQVYPLSELNTNVIRPRAYDAILFGEVIGREGDFFAFWHSSQRNDPGLNLAMYANSKTDSLLSDARATTDRKQRDKIYSQFATIVEKDQPAIFLYSPEFIYTVQRSVQGIELGALTTPAERFLNVYDWYTDTERVLEIFANRR